VREISRRNPSMTIMTPAEAFPTISRASNPAYLRYAPK